MDNVIRFVQEGSPADRAGIRPGERLLSINGEAIVDVIDYQYLSSFDRLKVKLSGDRGEKTHNIHKGPDESLGLIFDDALMDDVRRCRNKCVFCFVDQMPKGLRETLYVKDDDWRMSMVMGSYITLTNVSDEEFERIIKRKASPLYISVHTTDPALRCRMMNNKNAGNIMERLTRLRDSGISFNCQIVLCPGWNDGDVLQRTMEDLFSLHPAAGSAAVVPVGLTKFREGLANVLPVTREKANELIDMIESFSEMTFKKTGERFIYASDEMYMRAERELPPVEYYGDMPQIENGVGLCAKLTSEYLDACSEFGRPKVAAPTLVATGVSAETYIRGLLADTGAEIVSVENEFFGRTITVAGLVTGGDLSSRLESVPKEFKRVLIPRAMLRASEDVFLDGMTLDEIKTKTGRDIVPVEVDGFDLRDALDFGE